MKKLLYEICPEDIGKNPYNTLNKTLCRCMLAMGFSEILPADCGKRFYMVNGLVYFENKEQYEKRTLR